MTYSERQIFCTMHGKGSYLGRAVVFCRFSGRNIRSGKESDRPGVICQPCEPDFAVTDAEVGGRFLSAELLATAICENWRSQSNESRFVVCFGGEPLRQIEIANETNGTVEIPPDMSSVYVSPKAQAERVVHSGDELKCVYTQARTSPEICRTKGIRHFFLQPMDRPDLYHNTQLVLEHCLANSQRRLSVQTHKQLGIQ
jgi:7-carboxy-7-deazaguanine synthase